MTKFASTSTAAADGFAKMGVFKEF